MKKRTKTSLWLVLPALALSLSAITFATAKILRHKSATANISTTQNPSSVTKSHRNTYVRRAQLSPRLAQNLGALGNRLEKPGQERLALVGMWRVAGTPQPREFAATLEFPDRLRMAVGGPQNRVITFDGQQTKAAQTSTADELDLIETLAYDSAEHFFATQMQGKAMRFLGARFRTDDGSTPDYDGPYFDIYKIADQIKASGEERAAKLYYFNSDTLLLERVTYVINRGGSEINVETRLSDWRVMDGQQVARRIERFENGKSVFVLTIRSAGFGGRADDGLFAQ
jgi:hypothetical protein